MGGAVFIYQSDPHFSRCLFEGNQSQLGGAVRCFSYGMPNPRPVFEFCTFTDNAAESCGGISHENSISTIKHCILWGNSSSGNRDESAQIAWLNGQITVNYSCIQGWTGVLGGAGNFGMDPRFVNPTESDWHLMPQSPCIDAGDPAADFSNEPQPNGGRVDIGAYGNTPEATITTDDDNDGAGTPSEIRWGLDPYKPDTDGDGLNDGIEVGYDGNPRLYDPYNPNTGKGTDLNAAVADTDGDGISDFDEINLYGTNPINPDSDGDGLKDGEELVVYGTNPLKKDSDGDTMDDGWEVRYQLNPTDPTDAEGDADQDGLVNRDEFLHNANPTKADSDGDGMQDAWEVQHGLRPDIDDSLGDLDGDGYSNGAEFRLGSVPDLAESIPLTSDLYVDDDAPNDPGPGNPTISDPLENGTADHPFDTLQEAVAAAVNGYVITVADGLYRLPAGLKYGGKNIVIRSQNGSARCVLDLQQGSQGIGFVNGETRSAVLEGFTITSHKGTTANTEGAVYAKQSSPIIRNCVVIGNRRDAIFVQGGSPLIDRCWLTENSGGVYGDAATCEVRDCVIRRNLGMGVYLANNSNARVDNCLIAENGTYYDRSWAVLASNSNAVITHSTIALHGYRQGSSGPSAYGILATANSGQRQCKVENSIVWGNSRSISNDAPNYVTLSVRYSDIQGGYSGEGNLDSDPAFIQLGQWDMGIAGVSTDDEWIQGDYHLMQNSPCINAGDPLFTGLTRDIDGQGRIAYGRTDMGADEFVGADFDLDGMVNLSDFSVFAGQWFRQGCGVCEWADFTGDESVGLDDLARFVSEWLKMPLLQPQPWPIAYWTFNEDYSDSVGPYNGSPSGDPVIVDASQAHSGRGALELDIDDSIRVPNYTGILDDGLIVPTPRTWLAWIKTTGTAGRLISWGNENTTGGLWRVLISEGKLKVNVNGGSVQSNSPINTGQWVHVAVVLPIGGNNTRDIQLYINGIREDQAIVVPYSLRTVAGDELLIGQNFEGFLDDMMLFDCALSREEVTTLAGLMAVNAGTNRRVECAVGATNIPVRLSGEIWNGSETVSSQWSFVSGPGEVVFENATALNTQAIFPIPGKYTLQLTVTDGSQVAQDEVKVFLSTGEVGYWGMDGDYSDTANGYTGIPAGDPAFVDAEQAKVGTGAVELDGNDYVSVNGYKGITGTKARTCTAWIKTTGTAGPIVYWGDKNTAGGMWEMRVNGSGQLRLQINGAGVNGATTVNTGQWVHVAAVLAGGRGQRRRCAAVCQWRFGNGRDGDGRGDEYRGGRGDADRGRRDGQVLYGADRRCAGV